MLSPPSVATTDRHSPYSHKFIVCGSDWRHWYEDINVMGNHIIDGKC